MITRHTGWVRFANNKNEKLDVVHTMVSRAFKNLIVSTSSSSWSSSTNSGRDWLLCHCRCLRLSPVRIHLAIICVFVVIQMSNLIIYYGQTLEAASSEGASAAPFRILITQCDNISGSVLRILWEYNLKQYSWSYILRWEDALIHRRSPAAVVTEVAAAADEP